MTLYSIDVNKTPASGVYVSSAQALNYLKVTANVTAENTLVESLTKAAEEQVEEFTNLCINAKDVECLITDIDVLDSFESLQFNLPYRGTISGLVVTKVDDGEETVVEDTNYFIKGRNTLVIKNVSLTAQYSDEYKIEYSVAPLNIPVGLTDGILKLIGDYYNNRTNDSVITVTRLSESTKALLTPFRDINSII